MTAHVIHIRRTLIIDYDVEREDYGGWTDAEIVAYETSPANAKDGWRLNDFDDGQVSFCSAEVIFR